VPEATPSSHAPLLASHTYPPPMLRTDVQQPLHTFQGAGPTTATAPNTWAETSAVTDPMLPTHTAALVAVCGDGSRWRSTSGVVASQQLPGSAARLSTRAGSWPSQTGQTGIEMPDLPPSNAIVAAVLQVLVAQGHIAEEDAGTYVSLWRLLDSPRQGAAQRLLVAALSWQQSPQLAVDHIKTVISQNRP
jgi:hypothetical protein